MKGEDRKSSNSLKTRRGFVVQPFLENLAARTIPTSSSRRTDYTGLNDFPQVPQQAIQFFQSELRGRSCSKIHR
jgi:hypothetical protein